MFSLKASSTLPHPKRRKFAYLNHLVETSCDGDRLQHNREYCIVLSSGSDAAGGMPDVKSKYIRYQQGRSGDRLLWRKPFGDKMLVPEARSYYHLFRA